MPALTSSSVYIYCLFVILQTVYLYLIVMIMRRYLFVCSGYPAHRVPIPEHTIRCSILFPGSHAICIYFVWTLFKSHYGHVSKCILRVCMVKKCMHRCVYGSDVCFCFTLIYITYKTRVLRQRVWCFLEGFFLCATMIALVHSI